MILIIYLFIGCITT